MSEDEHGRLIKGADSVNRLRSFSLLFASGSSSTPTLMSKPITA